MFTAPTRPILGGLMHRRVCQNGKLRADIIQRSSIRTASTTGGCSTFFVFVVHCVPPILGIARHRPMEDDSSSADTAELIARNHFRALSLLLDRIETQLMMLWTRFSWHFAYNLHCFLDHGPPLAVMGRHFSTRVVTVGPLVSWKECDWSA